MPHAKPVKLTEEEQKLIRQIVDDFELEDDEIRKAQVRTWKKFAEYWHGLQMVFWSERDQSWISPDDVHFDEVFSAEEIGQLGPIYDYVVDIYRAHGESIIAALASTIPALRYRPDDADDESDRLTAKTYSKISDLIYIHNKAKLLFIHALFYIYNFGNVFSYRYIETDPKFGTYKVPIFDSQPVKVEEDSYSCAACGNVRQANDSGCGACGSTEPPTVVEGRVENRPIQIGEDELPKSRVKVEVFGPLHVKVPFYARSQDSMGYVILKTDQNKALIKSIHEDIEDEIEGERTDSNDRFTGTMYSYPHDIEEESMDLVTVTKAWLRPWTLFRITDKAKRKVLLARFPAGVQVTFIGKNKVFAEAFDESLDDRWQVGKAGLSEYIHADPTGRTLMPLQDMRNQLVNLTMDIIDHSSPAVYADSEVLDFDTYGRFESQPGVVVEAKGRPGQPLAGMFYAEPRTAMSKEHMLFFRQIDQDAQFSSGDFPAIHGGPSEGKSRTLGEYAMSKQMALQRLSIAWEFLLDWWIRTVDGCVKSYADVVMYDDRYSKKENNDYINVWIRRTEMEGKVGGVEPEGGGAFPVSIVQKRDTVFKLFELHDPVINEALYLPNNARLLKDILALDEFEIPGEEQRVKQAREINQLIKEGQEPVDIGGTLLPSVGIDADVDDHEVHISVLRSFLVGTVGLDLKETNPAGYMNCIGHLQMHKMALITQSMGAVETGAPEEKPPKTAAKAPKGE